MGTGEIMLGITLRWTSIPSKVGGGGGGVEILLVASCYGNWDKPRQYGHLARRRLYPLHTHVTISWLPFTVFQCDIREMISQHL